MTDGTFPGPQGRADGGEINRSDASDGMAWIRPTDDTVGTGRAASVRSFNLL